MVTKKCLVVYLLLLSSLATAISAYWISQRAFHRAPITTDEQSYLLQAHIFAKGQLKYDPPPFLEPFLYEMVVVDREKGWFSRYPPAHAAWLTLGVWLGDPYLATAIAAGIGFLAVALSIARLGGEMVASLIMLFFSPFYFFTNGTLLSHVTGFSTSALMLLFFVRWQQKGGRLDALLAGLFWAMLFLNRTYTALLMAIPLGVYSLWSVYRQRERQQVITVMYFAMAAASGVIAIMVYNYLMVGNPFQMTYLYYWPTDGLGFGLRHHGDSFPASTGFLHTPRKGFADLMENLKLLDLWLLGCRGGLILWVVLAMIGVVRPLGLMLTSLLPVVALGYVYFWFAGWNQTGPNYYMEALPAMILSASLGLALIRDRIFRQKAWYYGTLIILCVFWHRPLLAFARSEASSWRDAQASRSGITQLIDSVKEPAIIFMRRETVREAWPDNDMAFTPEGVNGQIIVTRWLDAYNHAVVKYFKDRKLYTLVKRAGAYALDPLDRLPTFSVEFSIPRLFRTTGTNVYADNDRARMVRVARPGDPPGFLLRGRYAQLYPGKFEVRFEAKASTDHAGTLQLVTRHGEEVLAGTLLKAGEQWQTISLKIDSPEYIEVEPQALYHGGGDVDVRRVLIREVD
jgi:hypothetical protein